jgi:hypothetical protein
MARAPIVDELTICKPFPLETVEHGQGQNHFRFGTAHNDGTHFVAPLWLVVHFRALPMQTVCQYVTRCGAMGYVSPVAPRHCILPDLLQHAKPRSVLLVVA